MEKRFGLTGNQLKLIAALTMLADHLGYILFPRMMIFRILGRIAFPLYAYMIAEGCRYTRNKLRYFLMLFGLGAGCQLVYYIVSKDTYLNILLTFSLSVLLIYALQAAHQSKRTALWSGLFCAGVLAVMAMDMVLTIDYGFWGAMVPVLAAFGSIRKFPRWGTLLLMGAGLVLIDTGLGAVQYISLLALPLLMLYSGQRGKANMKYFFYIFYPLHLVVLEGISMLLK